MPVQDSRITHGHANRSTEASYNRASGVVELTKQHPLMSELLGLI